MSPFHGVQQFVEGARIARSPQLVRYSWVPALSSAIIIGLGLALASGYVSEFSTWLVAQLPDWLSFLERILTPVLYLFGLLFGAWTFGFLAVIIAGPFLGNLSRKVEVLELGDVPDDTRSFLAGLLAGIKREARKLGYYLPRLFLVLLITLIPVINIAAPIIVVASVFLGAAIIVEATLSFLGVSGSIERPSWGAMIADPEIRRNVESNWWLVLFPGMALVMAIYSINMFGDALRDVLDPRLRGTGGGRYGS